MRPQPARIHLAEASRMYTRRLQGIMSRLQRYNYMKCGTNRGENLHPADTLPRAYLPTIAHLGAEFEHIITTAFLPVSTSRLQEIQQATKTDKAAEVLKSTNTSRPHSNVFQAANQYSFSRKNLFALPPKDCTLLYLDSPSR